MNAPYLAGRRARLADRLDPVEPLAAEAAGEARRDIEEGTVGGLAAEHDRAERERLAGVAGVEEAAVVAERDRVTAGPESEVAELRISAAVGQPAAHRARRNAVHVDLHATAEQAADPNAVAPDCLERGHRRCASARARQH